IGKDRGYVVNRLRAARAPADVRALIANKPDTLRAVAYLTKVADPDQRATLIAQLRTGMITGEALPEVLPDRAGAATPPAAPAASSGSGDGAAAARRAAEALPPRIGNAKLRAILRALTV